MGGIWSAVFCFGGKTGIRTLGTVARSPHFECGPIDHSGIFPFFSGTKIEKIRITHAFFKRKLDKKSPSPDNGQTVNPIKKAKGNLLSGYPHANTIKYSQSLSDDYLK